MRLTSVGTLLALPLLPFSSPASESPFDLVPGGTKIEVVLQEQINSEEHETGAKFHARVLRAARDGEPSIIEEGSDAKVELVSVPHHLTTVTAEEYALELSEVWVRGAFRETATDFAAPKRSLVPGARKSDSTTTAGTIDTDSILAGMARGEEATAVAVHKAGVVFQVLQGPEVHVAKNMVLEFTLVEPLAVPKAAPQEGSGR